MYIVAKSGWFRSNRAQAVKCRGKQISWFLTCETYSKEKFFFSLQWKFPYAFRNSWLLMNNSKLIYFCWALTSR